MIPLSKSKPDWKSLLEIGNKLGISATRELDAKDIKPETDLHYLTCLWNLDESAKVNVNVFPEFLLHHLHLSFLYHGLAEIEMKLMERSQLIMRSVKSDGNMSVGIISGTLYEWKRLILESKDYQRDLQYILYINKVHELLNQMGYSKIFDCYERSPLSKGAYILV